MLCPAVRNGIPPAPVRNTEAVTTAARRLRASLGWRHEPDSPLDAASLLADDEARFTEVNDQAVNLLHYPREALLRMRVWDITPEMQRPDALQLWQAFIAAGEQSGVYQARRADGRLVTVEYVAVANYRPGAHLSVLRPIARSQGPSRALDECPYERPFPVGFSRCPAYQPHLTYESDSTGEPVAPVWTCQHLGSSRHAEGKGFYGRCGVGDALARTRWLAVARTSQLRQIQELRMAFAEEVGPQLADLYRARAATVPRSQDQRGDWQRVATATDTLIAAVGAYATSHSDALMAAGIEPTELTRCYRASIDDFKRVPAVEGWSPPASVVGEFSGGIRAFMRPDLYATAATTA